MEPLVSVIIPTYKRDEILSRAINSVLNQTYSNIEIIVVDDNDPNTDFRHNTELLMKRYENNHQVKYIKHDKNKNGSAARNTGIKWSNGVYIAFLDDDDEFLPDKIEKQVATLERLDATWGACYTSYYKMNKHGYMQNGFEKRQGNLLVEALMRNLYIQAGSNLLVRKEVVNDINGFDESFIRNQDLEFLVRLFEKYKIAYVDSYSVIIHYEVRQFNRSYAELQNIDAYYLEKFAKKIENLKQQDQRRIYTMIALDSVRSAVKKKEISKCIDTIRKNKISFITLVRYFFYLFHRFCTRRSYGFKL